MPLRYSDAATGDLAYMIVQTGVFAALAVVAYRFGPSYTLLYS